MLILLWMVAVLATVSCSLQSTAELSNNMDRILVECSPTEMKIYVRKDIQQFFIGGHEPECEPTYGNFTEYDGQVIAVKKWTLPLHKGTEGPCGLWYLPIEGSSLWAHTTKLFGFDRNRTLQCIDAGVLNTTGAHIRVEQITPRLSDITQPEGVVEVPRRATLGAYFAHNFPENAGLSLHPIRCWIENDRRKTRKLVIDGGCPVKRVNSSVTYVSISAETANEISNDKPHIFFNAEHRLLEDEDPADLPSFRLTCDVIPCKGLDFYQQVIGAARCPSIARCQTDRRITQELEGVFQVSMNFSVMIGSRSIPAEAYRPLGETIYPGGYWLSDTPQREGTWVPEDCTSLVDSLHWLVIGLALASLALGVVIVGVQSRRWFMQGVENRNACYRYGQSVYQEEAAGWTYQEKKLLPLLDDNWASKPGN